MAPGLTDLRDRLAEVPEQMKAHAIAAGPVRWGIDDCLMSYAALLEPVVGYDVAEPFRGKYGTPDEARCMLQAMGFSCIADAVSARARDLCWCEVDLHLAQAGDVGVLDVGSRQSCAMLHRSGFWIARSMSGFAAAPSSMVRAAWSLVTAPRLAFLKPLPA